MRMVQSLSAPLARLPMSITSAVTTAQRVGLPLFGPAAPLKGMADRLVDTSPLYAGESGLRIESVIQAADAVLLLSGALVPARAERPSRAVAASDRARSRTIR